jgi:hypothetical protein
MHKGTTVETFLIALNNITVKLSSVGIETTDKQLINVVLKALPTSFGHSNQHLVPWFLMSYSTLSIQIFCLTLWLKKQDSTLRSRLRRLC